MEDVATAIEDGSEVAVPEGSNCYQTCFYQAISMTVLCAAMGGSLAACYTIAVGWYATCMVPCLDECLDGC